MMDLFDFCQYSFDLLSVGVLFGHSRNGMLFILFKAIEFHHS